LLFSQTDEIQVYDAAIAEPGVFNLMIHANFTPIGRKTPDFPDAIIANQSFQTTAEWAYGVTNWFEQGLYLPVTTPIQRIMEQPATASSCESCSCVRMPPSTCSSMV
jgi:hypothetical protein